MFRSDCRKIFLSPLFYISILVLMLGALSSAWQDMKLYDDLLYLSTGGWVSGNSMVVILLPLLGGMASAGSYCDERQTGYHYSVMVRGSRLGYCVSKVCSGILGSFLMVLAAGILFPLVCFVLKGGDVVLAGEEARQLFADQWESVFFEKGYPVLAWLSRMCMYGVAAAVWPALALCVSLFVRNRYVVMVSPFVAEQLAGTLAIGIHQYHMTYTILLPDQLEGAYSGWGIRLLIVAVVCLIELAVFVWGVMRETR